MSERVQLSRKKGWKLPASTVSVARPGRWGNPFHVGDFGIPTAADAVQRHREWLDGRVVGPPVPDLTFNARIGGKVVTGTLADISAAWANHRDKKNLGSSRYSPISVADESGAEVGYISYNAKVWPAGEWLPKTEAMFDPASTL